MKSSEIRDLAIKRHDIDASFFQETYLNKIKNVKKVHPFRYGRSLILEDLKKVLDQLPAGARVLDIGSGTGHMTDWIASMGFDVTGIEPSMEMIGFARNNFPKITFVEGISSAIPFDAASFDLVVAFEVFRYLDEKENKDTFADVYRVLKPGGQFFFTQVNRSATDLYFLFYYIKKLAYQVKDKVYHFCYFTTPAHQEDLMKSAGYREVQTIGRMSATIRFAYKLGKSFGDGYVKLMEKIFGRQRFTKGPLKSMAGHLIVIGRK